MTTLHSEVYRGHLIEVKLDECPDPPDQDDGLFLVAFHRNFTVTRHLNHHHNNSRPLNQIEDVELWEDTHHLFDLFAHIHGGVLLSLGQFSCPWDSGQVGYVLASKAEWPDAPLVAAKGLVEDWNAYNAGDVVGYEIHKDGMVESCWGFVGCQEACLEEARGSIDHMVQHGPPQPLEAGDFLRMGVL